MGLASFIIVDKTNRGYFFKRKNFEGAITTRVTEIARNAFTLLFEQEIAPVSIDYTPEKCDGVRRAYKSVRSL
jgi:hypothetical protein